MRLLCIFILLSTPLVTSAKPVDGFEDFLTQLGNTAEAILADVNEKNGDFIGNALRISSSIMAAVEEFTRETDSNDSPLSPTTTVSQTTATMPSTTPRAPTTTTEAPTITVVPNTALPSSPINWTMILFIATVTMTLFIVVGTLIWCCLKPVKEESYPSIC